MRPSTSKPTRNQRGAVLIWVTFFLVVLLGFVALGIDVAKVMATRSQLQNAADAAALSGASAVDPTSGLLVEGIAKSRAYYTATKNSAFVGSRDSVIVDTTTDVVVSVADSTVWVKVRRENGSGTGVIPYFSQIFGTTFYNVAAQATAKVVPSNPCALIIPIAVQPEPGVTYQTGCANEYILKEGGGSGVQEHYGGIQFPPCPDGPCGSLSSQGAALLRCQLDFGYSCCLKLGDCIPAQTGVMSGPIRQAIQDRFSRDTDGRQGICYEGPGGYHGNMARVVIVPITGPVTGGGGGCYTIQSFASFFIKSIPSGGANSVITAEFIDFAVPGNGAAGGNTFSYAVHLIK
jgi:hypothetical protein